MGRSHDGRDPPDDVRFFDADAMAEYTQQVMLRAAATGDCVIVGRGAQCVLQDHDDAFHVFIYAPWAERVGRVRARAQSSPDVEELMRVADHERASYLRTYYGCDWKDPHLYHLMINAQIGAGMAARMIVNAVQEGCYGAAPDMRTPTRASTFDSRNPGPTAPAPRY